MPLDQESSKCWSVRAFGSQTPAAPYSRRLFSSALPHTLAGPSHLYNTMWGFAITLPVQLASVCLAQLQGVLGVFWVLALYTCWASIITLSPFVCDLQANILLRSSSTDTRGFIAKVRGLQSLVDCKVYCGAQRVVWEAVK